MNGFPTDQRAPQVRQVTGGPLRREHFSYDRMVGELRVSPRQRLAVPTSQSGTA